MPDIKQKFLDIAQKIGLVKKTPSKTAVPKPGVKPAGKKEKFDFNMFIKATQDFWEMFLTKHVPEFFKAPIPHLKKYPDWFKKLSKDEKAAHIIVYTGSLFVVAGIVFLIVV